MTAAVSSTRASGQSAKTLAPDAVLSQAGAENFPVASRLLPSQARSHLLAIYGFARLVDDIGDEVEGDRLVLLDALERDLERTYSGMPADPLLVALKPTVAQCGLPIEPFKRLIEANRRDQLVHRYQSFDELLGYCALSANPVGELVLRVFGAASAERIVLSDKVCTGLQLVEHWQDVAEDYSRGRVYLPSDDRERFGVSEEQLGSGKASAPFRHLLAFEVARARELLSAGAPLIRTLNGRQAFAVAAFVAGGRAALNAIERAGFDVLGARPRPTKKLSAIALLSTLVAPSRRA